MELVPVPEGATPVYRSIQDTVIMNGMVGELSFGRLPIANDGDAPMTIEYIWIDDRTGNFFNGQWRQPLVVLPKTQMDIMTGFLPKATGSFEDRVNIKVMGIDSPFVYTLIGTAIASSVPDTRVAEVTVYPNPSSGTVTFRTVEPSRIGVTIRDLMGRLIWTGSANDATSLTWDGLTFDAGSCAPGSYHAVVTVNSMTTGTLILRR
jgi:hypothetical protein